MTSASSVVKITRPRVTGIHERKRLTSLLDQCRDKSVIWLSGPGGAGKTTLISSYLETRRLHCLWYQIDESDADLSTFFYYLGLAAKKAAPRYRKPLPLLTPAHLPGISFFTRKYFQELYSRLKTPFTIVFDNYQDISIESKLHAVLATALTILPEGITAFVLSRRDPPLEYVRLRANGTARVIGWEDIRFTLDETKNVIENKGLHLSDKNVKQIIDITEGWIAGLVLFLERMKWKGSVQANIHALNKESIFDYFAAELFNNVDAETREFLLKTAFLPIMSPLLAGLLTGMTDAAQILSSLNKDNFFTAKLEQHNTIYQYHQLFREFLLSRAQETFSREEVANIRHNAATLLESAERIEDAAGLFLKNEDWESIVRLVCLHAPALHRQGRDEVIREWLHNLPEGTIESNPQLLYWRGTCLTSINPENSHRNLVMAFEMFRVQNDRVGMLLTWADVADSMILQVDFDRMKKWHDVLKEVLDEDPLFPTKEIELRITMSMFNSKAFGQPDDPEIGRLSERALALIENETDLDVNIRLMTGVHLNGYYVWTGNLSKAERIAELFDKYSNDPAVLDLVKLSVKSSSCLYAIFSGKHDACMKTMLEAIQLADKCGIQVRNDQIMCHGLASALSQGNMEMADDLFAQLAPRMGKALRFDQAYYYSLTAWRSMIDGNIARAYEYQEKARHFFAALQHIAVKAVVHFGMADILFHLSRNEDAENELVRGYEISRRMRSKLLEFMGGIIEAHNALALGQNERGMEVLQKVLAIGREQGFTNFMWWRPSLITPLCIKALEAEIEVEYVQSLVRKRKLVPAPPPVELENWPFPLKIRTLGRFELMRDDQPMVFAGKVQQKPLALLKVLIAFGGKGVSESQLIDALWPEAEGDAANRNLDITLHRLRKLLGDDEAILMQEGQMSLNDQRVWTDAWGFERLLCRVEDMWKQKELGREFVAAKDPECPNPAFRRPQPDFEETIRLTEKALALYTGHFLPVDFKEPWAISLRERLRSKFLYYTKALGNYRQQSGRYDLAVERYQRGIEIDDLAEELYQQLMICHHKLGQEAEVVKVYYRCRAMLHKAFGLEPSTKTKEIYSSIRRSG